MRKENILVLKPSKDKYAAKHTSESKYSFDKIFSWNVVRNIALIIILIAFIITAIDGIMFINKQKSRERAQEDINILINAAVSYENQKGIPVSTMEEIYEAFKESDYKSKRPEWTSVEQIKDPWDNPYIVTLEDKEIGCISSGNHEVTLKYPIIKDVGKTGSVPNTTK